MSGALVTSLPPQAPPVVIRSSEKLRRFERRQAREHAPSYERALAIFAALWAEARLLDPGFPHPERWEEDLAPDLAVARALNGLPPEP